MSPSLWHNAYSSSQSSGIDEDDDDSEYIKSRVNPDWTLFRDLFRRRGFHLDTIRDAKLYYERYPQRLLYHPGIRERFLAGHDDDLCPDAGLPNNLFRGARICDGRKIVVKAVHIRSRELDIITFLSSSPQREHPMNHCIPVLDIIHVPSHKLAFVVMEEWSSQFLCEEVPPNLFQFLSAIRQCIEHLAFMHKHHIAHLDISSRNILTDFKGKYAYIDFENSQRFGANRPAHVSNYRGTEVPPECDGEEQCDPYKIDVWALAILILQASHRTGYNIPGVGTLIAPMLAQHPEKRPSMASVLAGLNSLLSRIPPTLLVDRLCHGDCNCASVESKNSIH